MVKAKDLKEKILITILYLFIILLAYHLNFSCVYRQFLNIPCPGCGMTRACLSVLKFDFVKAFNFHPMFWSVPILYLYFLFDGNLFKNKKINMIVFGLIVMGFLTNWGWKILQLFTK